MMHVDKQEVLVLFGPAKNIRCTRERRGPTSCTVENKAIFTQPVVSDSDLCLSPVSELASHEKGPFSASSACSTCQKVRA